MNTNKMYFWSAKNIWKTDPFRFSNVLIQENIIVRRRYQLSDEICVQQLCVSVFCLKHYLHLAGGEYEHSQWWC